MAVYGNLILENNMNISSDTVQKYYNYFHESEILNEAFMDQVKEKVMRFADSFNGFFNDVGFSFTNGFKNLKDCAIEIKDILLKHGIKKESFKLITESFQRCLYNFNIYDNIDLSNSKFLGQEPVKIKKAIILFFNMLIISLIVMIFCCIFFTPTAGSMISIWLFCPIVEEMYKAIAIKGGYIAEFTLLFNAYEIISYTAQNKAVFGVAKMIKIRLKTATMHLSTTIIQYLLSNKKLLAKLGIKEDNIPVIQSIGQVIGCIIHCAWNYNSIYNEKFIQKIIK